MLVMLWWLPLFTALLSMPVFAVVRRGRAGDPDVARRATTILIGRGIRDWMMWALAPVETALVNREVSPNALNVVGLILAVLSGVALVFRSPASAAWLLAVSGLTDILDGRMARRMGRVSDLGDFIDSTFDRFAETAVFIGVAWYLGASLWMFVATLLAISGSLMVSYTRARGEIVGVNFDGGIAQRPERIVILAVGALVEGTFAVRYGWQPGLVLGGAVVLIAVASTWTAIYRTWVIIVELMRRADTKRDGVAKDRAA